MGYNDIMAALELRRQLPHLQRFALVLLTFEEVAAAGIEWDRAPMVGDEYLRSIYNVNIP